MSESGGGSPSWLPDQGESKHSSIEQRSDTLREAYSDEILGVPLMKGEQVYWRSHPSFWTVVPILTGSAFVALLVLGVAVLYYTGMLKIAGPFRTLFEVLPAVFGGGSIESMSSAVDAEAGSVPLREVVDIPFYVFLGLFVTALVPFSWREMNRRWVHYVVTNYRVMRVQSFPNKTKDWSEIPDIKSFTSGASVVERILGVGHVEFLPANNDNVVFGSIEEYEYWESKVKELQRKYDRGEMDEPGEVAGEPDDAPGGAGGFGGPGGSGGSNAQGRDGSDSGPGGPF
jgi:uncharacterized membrane protein YgcG